MFGIIPKAVWSRKTASDEQNRIALGCNCLLVEWEGSGGRRAIIETGHGAKYGEKERGIFAIDAGRWLLPELAGAGVDAASISDVIVTHLHFDHAGGLTQLREGVIERTFPKAAVHVQRREYEDARANFGIMTMTYREENFGAVDAGDAWRLHDGPVEPIPGVRLIPTPGHTRGHQSILVQGRERGVLFLGDVMPTREHVGAAYNMGYDLLPLENREAKRRMLSEAAEREWLVVLDHEPVSPVVRVRPEGGYFAVEPA